MMDLQTATLSISTVQTVSEAWLLWMLTLLVRSLLVLAGALVLTALLKQSAAALRHFVWFAAVTGIALIPLVGTVVPTVGVDLGSWFGVFTTTDGGVVATFQNEPSVGSGHGQLAPFDAATLRAGSQNGSGTGTLPGDLPGSPAGPEQTAWSRALGLMAAGWSSISKAFPPWLALVWLSGAVLLLGRLVFAHTTAYSLVRRSQPLNDDCWDAGAGATPPSDGNQTEGSAHGCRPT